MRMIKQLLSAALCLAAGSALYTASACGYCYSLPEEYYVYRISDNYLRKVEIDPAYLPGSDENCALWMKQLQAENIGKEEVYEIVYKADMDSLAALAKYNAFASILLRNPEARKVLQLAKDCEKARFAVTGDPWYYPVGDDSEHQNLQQIVARAKNCTSDLFRSRYFLQEVRALFTLGRYEEIISRWAEMDPKLEKDILKDLAFRYVAGAYFNIGESEKAVSMFLEAGDLTSAIGCSEMWDRSELEAVVELDVNYRGIRDLLEQEIHTLCFDYNGSEEWRSERLSQLRELCKTALDKNPADKALWHYTAAYIDYYTDNYSAAKRSLKKARRTVADGDILEGSIKVLGILNDARSSRHGFFYEHRLLRDLKWLDAQIVNNLTDEARDKTAEGLGWMMRENYSYYYWNDMMRALTLGILAPAYLKQGKTTKAMQMANMADNRLLALTGVTDYDYLDEPPYYVEKRISMDDLRSDISAWKPDYSNNIFAMLDSLGADKARAYYDRVEKPRTEFDRFTAERSYTDPSYFNDIIGTLLIRERRYDEAVTFLEKIPEGFQWKLNTNDYLADDDATKLNYAREMVDLAKRMKDKDDYTSAEAKYLYGQNLMRQYRINWALSYYSWSAYPDSYIEKINEEGMSLASSLIKDGMSSMPDMSYAAKMQYAMCNYATVAEHYPDTEAASWVMSFCDTWEDYHREEPDHWEVSYE